MSNIKTSFVNESIPQTKALENNQVLNPAGGYVWKVDDLSRLRRFLMLGIDGGTYYADERTLTRENAKVIVSLAKTNGTKLINEIVSVSLEGRAAKQDPTFFALALTILSGNEATKKAGIDAIQVVCRTGGHIFTFMKYYDELGGGWGRAMRNAISKWYNDKTAGNVIYQTTKYQNKAGWTHRDLLRLAHPKPATMDHDKVYEYIVKGELNFPLVDVVDDKAFARLEAIFKAKSITNEKEMVALIQQHNLMREHIPTKLQKSPLVQEALLQKMPMTAMIRNLNRMTVSGLVAPMSNASKLIVEKLSNEEYLQQARVHPFNVLVALKTYSRGSGFKGKLSWTPVQQVVDSLDEAFYATFKNVEPTGKNFFIAVDVSSSMTMGYVNGSPSINPRVAAAAMALITANVEKNNVIMGFSHKLVDLNISPKMRLDSVVNKINSVRMGGTDCSLPMETAQKENIPVDTFIVYTDNETYHGKVHPAVALKNYRKASGINSRLITCAFTGGYSTIADPNDSGMMDLSGFDSSGPEFIREFTLGNI